MIAYIQVQPTTSPETFRVDLENHTDTLRISELYTRNTGMDDDRYPDYKSEHEIISQLVAGITTIKGIISQAKTASRRYDEELDDYMDSTGWTASFKLYNQTFNYLGIEHRETPEEDPNPIGDSGPKVGELLIIPPDINAGSKPWGEWVRDTRAGSFETARHFNKPVCFCYDNGKVQPICNLDLAYKFKNLSEYPNLLNSHPEAFDELRADLGVSYFFERKNETSE